MTTNLKDTDAIFSLYQDLQKFVDWTDKDVARMQSVAVPLQKFIPAIIEDFLAEAIKHPVAKQVLTGGQEQLDRLRVALGKWIHDLLNGPYDKHYVANRWKIGWRHVELGLDQTYSNVGLSRLRKNLLLALEQILQNEPQASLDIRRSLNTLLDLDLAIINDAYKTGYAQELEEFAFIASHDLRAPLRAIHNLTAWLKDDLEGKIDEKSKDKMDLLQQRAKRMDNLVEGLLQYSRIGRTDIEKKDVYLPDLLKEISEMIDLQDKKIITAESLPSLYGNKMRLYQLFSNLIDNAVKHHDKAQGTIEVSWSQDNQFYNISVKDDGPGIDPRFHKKIFEIFQTLGSKSTTAGMGLALVKKIVMEVGGDVTVESELGKGAKFIVKWPKNLPTRSV